jgi:type IV secretory pathway VirB10-like protein
MNPLSAQRSPTRVGAAPGTRRLTNRPVVIVCAGAAVITACVLWAGAHLNQGADKTPEQEHGGNAKPAEELRGPQGVMVQRPASAPTASPTVAPPAPSPAPAETADDRRRAAYLAAMQAGASVEGADFAKYAKPHPSMPPQQVAMLEKQDPNNAYDAQRVYRAYGPPPAPMGNGQDAGGPGGYAGAPNRWALNSTVQTPVSPYVLQPGWNIPAFLKDLVNSDLPGQVTAQVASDVCDTPT